MSELAFLPNLSYEKYCELPGVRASHLGAGLVSMAHFQAVFQADPEEEGERRESDALRFGKIFHKALLEPNEYRSLAVVTPDFGKGEGSRKRKWEWEEQISVTQPDALIFKNAKEREKLDRMACAFLDHPLTKAIFGKGERRSCESVIVWENPETGVPCKARIDYWAKVTLPDQDKPIIIATDLKSTTAAETEGFTRDAYKYGYHLAAPHYLEGLSLYLQEPVADFIYIAIEKTAPYGVRYFSCDPLFLEAGREQRLHVLRQVAECSKTGVWPCYRPYFTNLYVPEWVARKAEESGSYVQPQQ